MSKSYAERHGLVNNGAKDGNTINPNQKPRELTQRINVIPAAALNTYKVLNADVLVMAEGALNVVDANLNK